MGWSIVTLLGHNQAYNVIHGADIFDGIILPEGIDKEPLIDRIMIRCEEFSVMHTDIEYMHAQILNFFKIHYETFKRWDEALKMEYNPIENYDRYEDYSGNGDTSGENHINGTNNSTDTLTKASYNSSSYEPYEKNTTIGSDSSNANNSGSYNDAHTSHIHGNIGVTTNAQMLEQELEIRRFNIYKAIADMFCDEFCIMVY